MKAIAIHATRNTHGKSDATGAFVPEAVAFQKHYACYREGFDNTLPEALRRARVESILGAHRGLDLVALFCHGYRRGLQTEHDMQTVGALADANAAASAERVVVALYACSTAHELAVGRGGFADALRDALTARGKTGHVDAHTTAAHTVWNPMVQRFDMGDALSETVGDWIVKPATTEKGKRVAAAPEWRSWTRRLRADGDVLCYRFPLMNRDEILAELRK
jgi:hypothetical protein